MALAVMLAGERFAAMITDEGALVGVGAQMRSQIVGTREALWAETALEGGRMLLCAFVSSRAGVGDV